MIHSNVIEQAYNGNDHFQYVCRLILRDLLLKSLSISKISQFNLHCGYNL